MKTSHPQPRSVVGRSLRRTAALAVAGVVAAAAGLVVPATLAPAPVAQAAAVCDTAKGGTRFYPGDDSSRTYNSTFANSRSINYYLADYVPQGLGVWSNWNGGTEDLFLIGMHHEDENANLSLVYGISTTTGALRGAMYLPTGAHVGGLKTYQSGSKQWLYVQQDTRKLWRYNLATVRASFRSAGIQYVSPAAGITLDRDVSFFDIRGDKLYGGRFNEDNRDWMHRWSIGARGGLSRDAFRKQVPKKAQGLVVLSDTYVFSTSSGRNNRSNIYVTKQGYTTNFETTTYKCFAAPVLSQELVDYGGSVFLSFEGGADYFDGNFPWTTADNKIKNLHRSSVATLRDFVY